MTTIDLTTLDDPRDGIHRVVQALVEGNCVRLPLSDGLTPCLLATVEADPDARAEGLAGATTEPSLLFDSISTATDFLPELSPKQARLALRSVPGSIVFDVDREPAGPLDELPQSTRQLVANDDSLRLRLAGNPVTEAVISLLPAPLICGPASRLPEPAIDLEDGLERTSGPSVVRFHNKTTSITTVGGLDEDGLKRLLGVQVAIVCTGNTCRSPMAEVMLKSLLAKELRVPLSELEDAGITVFSAGLAARDGAPPSAEAVSALARRDLDLSEHQSQQATLELLQHCDVVLTMTQGHRASIVSQAPYLGELVQALVPDGRDVDDPIGGSAGVYEACLLQIEDALRARLPDFLALIDELQADGSNEST